LHKKLLRKGFKGGVYQYTGSIFTTVFGFIISTYLIRKLSIETYGIYNFIFSIIILAQLLTSLGLPQIIQRYLPEFKSRSDGYMQKWIVGRAMLIRFIASLVFVILFLAASNAIVSIFHIPVYFKPLFWIGSIIILFNLESQLLGEAVLVALLENKYANIARIIYAIARFGLFYFAVSANYGIYGIMWAWLGAEVILFLLYLIRSHSVVFSLPVNKRVVAPSDLKRFINFGGQLYLQNIVYFFRDKAGDIFFLAYFIGPHAVGLYSFVFGIPLMLLRLSPGSVLKPLLTSIVIDRYTKNGNYKDLVYYFLFFSRFTFFIMAPIFLISGILTDKIIIYMFNPAYISGKNLFILSLSFIMVHQFLYPYSAILYAMEKGRLILISSFVGLLNLVGDIVLIPIYGVLGAILATGISGIILIIYFHIAMKRNIGLKYPWESFFKFSLNLLPAGLLVFALRDFINNLFLLLLIATLGMIVYILTSYLNKGFKDRDRLVINSAIGKKIWVF